MKHLLFILLSAMATMTVAQTEGQRYLVFTFNRVYQAEGYIHTTGDHVWIVPLDSCLNGSFERNMYPLFVDSFQLECLEDSSMQKQGFGEFPISEYTKTDPNAWILYQNRKEIQTQTTKYTYPKSKDVLTIYCVPIIVQCSFRDFGYYHKQVMIFDCPPVVKSRFWEEESKERLRSVLHHDFSGFNYIVSLSNQE